MCNPEITEGKKVAEELGIDINDLLAPLDDEESSRVELEDGYTLILVDIPALEIRHEKEAYTTVPLGIILAQDMIITVCSVDTPILQAFINGRVKEFSTKKSSGLCIRYCLGWLLIIRLILGLLTRSVQR